MAEFVEILRIRRRICDSSTCDTCHILKDAPSYQSCGELMSKDPYLYEKICLDWADTHPEPVYPTWVEWHKTAFPNSDFIPNPCHFIHCIYSDKCEFDFKNIRCPLASQHIPAAIAEKFHINPIKEANNG